jgi:hypothetical protein
MARNLHQPADKVKPADSQRARNIGMLRIPGQQDVNRRCQDSGWCAGRMVQMKDAGHAGLQYARARTEIDGELRAMLVAGQFYASPPDLDEEQERIRMLAERHGIDGEALSRAAGNIPVAGTGKETQIGTWMEKIARTSEHVGKERSDMMSRLHKIADITAIKTL